MKRILMIAVAGLFSLALCLSFTGNHAPHKPHASTEKCPHVRSGYYRTSKNGKVSWVKSCVIHKDKFSEYASADEL